MKDERDRVYSSWRLSITKHKSRRNTFKSFWKSKARLFKKYDYGLYFKLLSKNELNDYLLKVQKEADDLYDRLVEEYKIRWNVTEELKQKNQIKWVLMMNNINNCIYEIINKEIIEI